jgi:hypothetical protein
MPQAVQHEIITSKQKDISAGRDKEEAAALKAAAKNAPQLKEAQVTFSKNQAEELIRPAAAATGKKLDDDEQEVKRIVVDAKGGSSGAAGSGPAGGFKK